MSERVIVQLPFAGFYNSIWSDELDSVEAREAEYFADERQAADGVPPDLRLDASETAEILCRCSDYSNAYEPIARAYVEAFNDVFAWNVCPDFNFEFEGMRSPQYYNYSTDRLFAWADLGAIRALAADIDRAAMDKVSRERHTSRSGFHSFYDPDWTTWGTVDEWDHNQFETLILAAIRATGEDVSDWDIGLYETLSESVYNAWSECVDWDQFESLCDEARDEKAAELREDDPDYEPAPARCAYTLDLFVHATAQAAR